MADEERVYVIPLRRIFLGFPKYKRANKALRGVREYLEKHLKSDKIRIGKGLNEEIWKHGIKEPPHHVKVIAKKDKDGVITAELFGYVDRKAKRLEEKQKALASKKPKEESNKKDKPKEDDAKLTKAKGTLESASEKGSTSTKKGAINTDVNNKEVSKPKRSPKKEAPPTKKD